MNFYASPEFLAVVAEVYFKGRRTSIEDVRIGGEVLRLLVVDDKQVITRSQFLDYHRPLGADDNPQPRREWSHAPAVVRTVVTQAEWERGAPGEFEPVPYLDWSKFPVFADYKAFIKQRRKGSVQKIERLRRRLVENVGELAFCMNDQQDDVLELARQWKRQQLRDTGERDYFADPKTIEFLRALRARGLLTSSSLRAANGRLLSLWLGFIYDKVWSGWIFTYDRDPEIGHYSPGHQLVQSMLQESHRLKHREFDFSIGDNPYKWMYATHVRLVGPLGRTPVQQRIFTRARQEAKKLLSKSPQLYDLAWSIRRTLRNYTTPG
jgi:CelD/BcsL family acetyltransferase involved in cellulose biosynthesis